MKNFTTFLRAKDVVELVKSQIDKEFLGDIVSLTDVKFNKEDMSIDFFFMSASIVDNSADNEVIKGYEVYDYFGWGGSRQRIKLKGDTIYEKDDKCS